MYEITLGLGTPLTIDEATINNTFGRYARILVDINFLSISSKVFYVEVVYEKMPFFCEKYKIIDHSMQQCINIYDVISDPALVEEGKENDTIILNLIRTIKLRRANASYENV